MIKKYLFSAVVVFFLIVAVIGYFFLLKENIREGEAVKALPANPVFVICCKNPDQLWENIRETSIISEELRVFDFFRALEKDISEVDSAFSSDGKMRDIYRGSEVYIASYITGKSQTNFLYLFHIDKQRDEGHIRDFAQRIALRGIIKQEKKGQDTFYSFSFPGGKVFHYTFVKGVFISGFNRSLVERSVRSLHAGGELGRDPLFLRLEKAAGRRSSAGIFINYRELQTSLEKFLDKKGNAQTESVFAQAASLDISFRPAEIVMNGFTSAGAENSLLGLFHDQKPAGIDIIKIAPENTVSLMFWGFSNFSAFREKYLKYRELSGDKEEYDRFVTDAKTNYGLNADSSFYSWIGNEASCLTVPHPGDQKKIISFAAFQSNRVGEAVRSILNLQEKTAVNNALPDTSSYKGFLTGSIPLPNLVKSMMGKKFASVSGNYFAVVSDYIVFSDSLMHLHYLLNRYREGKTLFFDPQYKAFAEKNLDNKASVFLYRNIRNSLPSLIEPLLPEYENELMLKQNTLNKFQAVAIQFSPYNDLFYTTALLKHAPSGKQETRTLWEAELDTSVSSRPYIMLNHRTGAKEIFIQDDKNTLYLISNTGKILWKKILEEKINGNVFQVDALRNNKLQLLFGTANAIHLLDRNGYYVEGFPLVLPSLTTAGISVFDYENNRQYRILVPVEDKRILSYTIEGDETPGWKFDTTDHVVPHSVQHCVVAGRDYIIFGDRSGKIYITDRQGRPRINLKESFHPPASPLFLETGKDLSRTKLVCIDSLGNVQKLSFDDKMETIKIDIFDSLPFFDYKDLDNDFQREYIFLDKNRLAAYKDDETLVFNYEFDRPASYPPLFFLYPDDEVYLGVVCPGEIFLLNNKGVPLDGFPLYGNTLFSLDDINRDGHFVLVTGGAKGNVLTYVVR